MQRDFNFDGIYLDEIAYDRVTIMRTKAVLGDTKLIDHHCDIGDMGGNSCAANYMEMYLLQPTLVSVKWLRFRYQGSARKSQKRFRDTPRVKFQAVLARIQPFLSRSVEKQGDQSRFKSLG